MRVSHFRMIASGQRAGRWIMPGISWVFLAAASSEIAAAIESRRTALAKGSESLQLLA
jgi:hypothetical protein